VSDAPESVDQRRERMYKEALALEADATQVRYLWYLSFAEPGRFLGACIVEAASWLGAVINSHALKCNPGGQVAIPDALPYGSIDDKWMNRLLSKEDIEQIPEVWHE